MSTLAALAFAGGFLPPAHNGGALITIFPPVGARHEHCPALGTGPRPLPVEQGGAQALIRWQNGGAEPLADKGVVDALNTDTRLPAVIQSKAVAVIVVAAIMYQPPDGPVLFVIQTDDIIGHAHPDPGWALYEAPGQCSA